MNINGYEIKPGADLENAILMNANLEGVDLENAILGGANLTGTILEKTEEI